MGRAPCCDKTNVKRGPWSPEEDVTLKKYVEKYGSGGNWIALPQKAGLKRCGKSCRLRWLNYLRPDIRHGGFTEEEDRIIFSLYKSIGSRWSIIASRLKGRTDNDVKNYWNTKLKKKLTMGNMAKQQKPSSPETKIENCSLDISDFGTKLSTLCSSMGTGLGYALSSMKFITNPLPLSGTINAANGLGCHYFSPSQEISVSCAQPVDYGVVSWSSHGSMEEASIVIDNFSPYEPLDDYGFQEKIESINQPLPQFLDNLPFLVTNYEQTPQELYESVTY